MTTRPADARPADTRPTPTPDGSAAAPKDTATARWSPRPLTTREQRALVLLLERGTSSADAPITPADRARWIAQVPQTLAGRPCGCGQCPSIELTDTTGRTPSTGDGRVVLEAESPGAMLMLFVDEDRLSYLELAPLDLDVSFSEFPDATDIHPV